MTLNEHALLKSLLITEIINNRCNNDTRANSKRTLRKLERTMFNTMYVRRTYGLNKTSTNLYKFTDARRTHNRMLYTIRSNYYKNCIANCITT